MTNANKLNETKKKRRNQGRDQEEMVFLLFVPFRIRISCQDSNWTIFHAMLMKLHYCLISDWVNPRSVSCQDNRESSDCSLSESFTSPSCTLGVDLRRGRRRFSGNLQLPPLSWRQGERSRTPDDEVIARPTSLPFGAPPRIDITPVDPEWWVEIKPHVKWFLQQ